jgi:hypothetical protein
LKLRYAGFLGLVLIIVSAGIFCSIERKSISFGEDSALFIENFQETQLGVNNEIFTDQQAVDDYFRNKFNHLETYVIQLTNQLIEEMQSEYLEMSADEQNRPLTNVKLISEFVMKARVVERSVDKLSSSYLKEYETMLSQLGMNEEEISASRETLCNDSMIIWNRDMIVHALDEFVVKE